MVVTINIDELNIKLGNVKKGLKMHENSYPLPVNSAEKSRSQITTYGCKWLLNINAYTAKPAGTAFAEDLPEKFHPTRKHWNIFLYYYNQI